jgi:hypothetical protein
MTTNIKVTTGESDKDYSAVRFGQAFGYENLRFIADRDPYGRLIVSGFVENALGGRFDLYPDNKTDEPVANNDEVWKEIKKVWKTFKKSIKLQRTFGEAFTCIFKSKNPETNGQPFLKTFEIKCVDDPNYELYNDHTIKKLKIDEERHKADAEGNSHYPHTFTTTEQLKNVWHNIQETKEHQWEGRSYLEPIWDEIQGLRAIRMGCVLFAIRMGPGLRIIILPPGTDPDIISDMKTAAQKWEAFNGFFVVPAAEGAGAHIESANHINFEEFKLVCLQGIAAYTNYPIAGFQGLEMERQAGDFQEEKVLDVYRVIQNEVEDQLRWLIARFSEYYDWGYDLDSDYIIKWRAKEEISDMAQATLDNLLATNDQIRITSGVKSVQEIRDELGLTGPPPEPRDMFGIKVSGLDKEKEDDEQDDRDNPRED